MKCGDMVIRVGCPDVGNVRPGGFAELSIATDWKAMYEDDVVGWEDKTVQQILPTDIDLAVGTLFITRHETLRNCMRMGFRSGAAVLVIGSGGNGLAFLSHARNLGATRVAMVGSASRQPSAVLAGATEYHDYRRKECWIALESGFDFVSDSVGASANVQRGQPCLKTGGSIGIYGLDEAGKLAFSPGRTFTFYNGGYDEAESHEPVLKFYRGGKTDRRYLRLRTSARRSRPSGSGPWSSLWSS